jgi:hypothetical protein
MKKRYRRNSNSFRLNLAPVAIGSLIGLLVLSGVSFGDNISISATVDRTEVTLGESIELTISLSGPVRSIPKPALPDLSDFDVYSSGTSSNISIIPGAISYKTDYSYVLVPRKAGMLTIKSAMVSVGGKTYATDPIQIRVTHQPPTGQPPPEEQEEYEQKPRYRQVSAEDFFIEQVVDNDRPYVGQQTTFIFRFYQAVNLYEQPSLTWPDYRGFWVEDLPPQKTYNKVVRGRSYRVTEIRKALFPTVSGKIKIDPTVMVIPPDAFSFFGGDPFDFFSRRRSRQSYTEKVLRAKAISLNVRSLPQANKPSGFSGAVGTYDFNIGIDRDTVEVDQPITLKAVVSGTGNIKKLPAIDIPQLENFRLYDSGSNENVSNKNYKVSGFKSFEWVLIPTAPGSYDLPELTFSYYDPWSKQYKTIARKSRKVFVKPSGVATYGPGDRAVNIIPAARTSLNYIITDLADNLPGKPLYSSKLIWIIQLLPVTWLIVLAVYTSRRRRLEGDIAYARRRFASKAARKALQDARNGLDNPEKFYNRIYNGIVGFISDKLNVKAAGMTNSQIIELLKETGKGADILEEFSGFLNQCDAGRFSPFKPSRKQMKEIYGTAERLLSTLDRGLK